jgi:hypothetical protein
MKDEVELGIALWFFSVLAVIFMDCTIAMRGLGSLMSLSFR